MSSEPSDHRPPPPPPPAGWRIGRYRVESVLGTGAFATVYRAVDERLDDTVAVKVLAENHSLDPEIRKRFLTEGRVLRRIDSPHVLAVHDLGETDRQQPFLVLEYAARGTLAQRVADLRAGGWRPGPADLRAVADPLAHALDAVHRAGLVHRDVNPGNVLLTTRGLAHRAPAPPATVVGPDERPVLADLGLCKDLALNSGHTSAGGTEGFRPPELRGGPAVIDQRADLWSLSALLFWLATGAPPDGTPVAPALAAAGLPAGLAPALGRSLADDPGHRHPDALAWLADVEAALAVGQPAMGAVAVAVASTGPWPGSGPGPAPWTVARGFGPHAGTVADAWPPGAPSAELPSSWRWRLRHSAWVLAALPFGLTTWIGFLYVGSRARRARWLWAAGAYGVAALAIVVLALLTPVDGNGDTDPESWQMNVGIVTMLVVWFGGLVHALLANRDWLRRRAAAT